LHRRNRRTWYDSVDEDAVRLGTARGAIASGKGFKLRAWTIVRRGGEGLVRETGESSVELAMLGRAGWVRAVGRRTMMLEDEAEPSNPLQAARARPRSYGP